MPDNPFWLNGRLPRLVQPVCTSFHPYWLFKLLILKAFAMIDRAIATVTKSR